MEAGDEIDCRKNTIRRFSSSLLNHARHSKKQELNNCISLILEYLGKKKVFEIKAKELFLSAQRNTESYLPVSLQLHII